MNPENVGAVLLLIFFTGALRTRAPNSFDVFPPSRLPVDSVVGNVADFLLLNITASSSMMYPSFAYVP